MCWKTITEKAKSNGRSGTTDRSMPLFWYRNAFGTPASAARAWAIISPLTSTACTSPNTRASARVTRPAPQPISSTRIEAGSHPWQTLPMSVRTVSASSCLPEAKNSSSVQSVRPVAT